MDDLSLIYKTGHCALLQCDRAEKFIMNFNGTAYEFRACELITFKRKIQEWDVVPMLSPGAPDIEIIHLKHCDRLVALTLHEILEIKDLFAGAFAMLELNSIIHSELVRKPMLR